MAASERTMHTHSRTSFFWVCVARSYISLCSGARPLLRGAWRGLHVNYVRASVSHKFLRASGDPLSTARTKGTSNHLEDVHSVRVFGAICEVVVVHEGAGEGGGGALVMFGKRTAYYILARMNCVKRFVLRSGAVVLTTVSIRRAHTHTFCATHS